MKKTYLTPEVCITKVGTESMIAISSVEGADKLGVNNAGTSAAGVTSGNVKGEDYNVWDDDWSK